MSIRLIVLYVFVAFLAVVAMRRWYVSLCGLLLLTVVTQNPSMPTRMFDIQGLNPWNVTFLIVFIAWLVNRRSDPQRAPAPHAALLLFGLYVATVVMAGLISASDVGSFRGDYRESYTAKDILVESIINPMKYVMIGVLFFDGAVTRRRVKAALFSAVASGLCYSILMFKTLKLRVFTMDFSSARRATDKLIGLFANDMAELLAFTLWAAVLLVFLLDRHWLRTIWLGLVVLALPAFIALKSRAGFFACCMAGLVLGALRWRRILLMFPIALVLILAFVPSVTDRVLTGVATGVGDNNWDEISSGRTTYLWPPAIEQIGQSLLLGHGRYAILRTDCFETILDAGGAVPSHPHSSYLEILLDAGVVGLVICLSCMAGLFVASWSLMRIREDRLMFTLGAIGMIAVVTELSAGVAGSSFFATQSAVPYLCVWGVTMRVATERAARTRLERARPATRENADLSAAAAPDTRGVPA